MGYHAALLRKHFCTSDNLDSTIRVRVQNASISVLYKIPMHLFKGKAADKIDTPHQNVFKCLIEIV